MVLLREDYWFRVLVNGVCGWCGEGESRYKKLVNKVWV
jgi:hypothetical protein